MWCQCSKNERVSKMVYLLSCQKEEVKTADIQANTARPVTRTSFMTDSQ
jgi:hypothetical protein